MFTPALYTIYLIKTTNDAIRMQSKEYTHDLLGQAIQMLPYCLLVYSLESSQPNTKDIVHKNKQNKCFLPLVVGLELLKAVA